MKLYRVRPSILFGTSLISSSDDDPDDKPLFDFGFLKIRLTNANFDCMICKHALIRLKMYSRLMSARLLLRNLSVYIIQPVAVGLIETPKVLKVCDKKMTDKKIGNQRQRPKMND